MTLGARLEGPQGAGGAQIQARQPAQNRVVPLGHLLGGPKGTDTATSRATPGLRSDQHLEKSPAVATKTL
eukprot:8722150-Pyramimonas_sp.AAC.1